MSALSKLLPKNNKAYVVQKTQQNKQDKNEAESEHSQPTKKRSIRATNKQKSVKPKKTTKSNKISKEELRKIKQREAENRAVNEYYAKQNRRKHAIISNYVKKAEEQKAEEQKAEEKKPQVQIPANIKNPTESEGFNIVKSPQIINFNKFLKSLPQETQSKPRVDKNKRPVAINRIINNYKVLLNTDEIDKALEKIKLKKDFEAANIDPGDNLSTIKTKIKINDDRRAHELERMLMKKRTH